MSIYGDMNLLSHQGMETRSLLLHRILAVATRAKDDHDTTDVSYKEVNCSCFWNCIVNSRIKPVYIYFSFPLFLIFYHFEL